MCAQSAFPVQMRVETSPLHLLHWNSHFPFQAVMSCRFPGQLTLSEQVGFTVWHFAGAHGCYWTRED